MIPLPWSFTSYEDFVNCPRSFHAKRVAKTVKTVETEEMVWGNYVHKQFENWQSISGYKLPDTLAEHEPFMKELLSWPGVHKTELKYALDRALIPCGFFDKTVWHRGVIDWHAILRDTARVVDYKTGKPHTKYKQLMLDALWIFARYPDMMEVQVEFYWTKSKTSTPQTYHRKDIGVIWDHFVPDLKQYVVAFATDTWQPRPSGLCNGWCPVKTCEHWKPKRTW
jgi:PD-(D/E)XK nuclease superfamily